MPLILVPGAMRPGPSGRDRSTRHLAVPRSRLGMTLQVPCYAGSIVVSSSLDGPKGLFIPIDGHPEDFEQSFRIDWRCDDPGVKACSLAFGVKLTEVEQKLKSVVADLEV